MLTLDILVMNEMVNESKGRKQRIKDEGSLLELMSFVISKVNESKGKEGSKQYRMSDVYLN